MSVSTEYTDNVFLSDNNRAYDFINIISPGFTARIMEKTRGADISYDIGYSSYDRFSENNTFRHKAELVGWMGISRRTRLDFRNSFLLTEEPGEKIEGDETETHVQEQETVRRKRESYYSNSVTMEFAHQISRTDSVNARYNFSILENKDTDVEDKSSHKPSVDLTYWLIPGRLGLRTGILCTIDETSDTPDDAGSREQNIKPSADMTYWLIPRRFKIVTGISYEKGNYSYTSDESDTGYESVNPSANMEYLSVPHKLSIEAGISYTKGISDKEPLAENESYDFTKWHGSIRLTKKFTRHFEGFFQYAHTLMDFKEDLEDDYKVYDPSLGIKYIVAEGVPLSLSIGYVTQDIKGKGNESDITVNGDLGKTWRFSRYGSLDFKTSSGYDESYLGAEKLGFGIYYDATCRAEYNFSRNISGDIFGSYKKERYTELETKRNEKTKEAGSGLTFQLKDKWLHIRVGYLYREVDSTSEEDSFRENRFSVNCTLSPPRAFRID